MIVAPVKPTDHDAWEDFLAGRPDALVYHSLAYRDLLAEQLGARPEYLVAWDSGIVRGVLPLMWHRSGILNALPFYGSHGAPIAADAAAETALLDAWDRRASDPSTRAATLVANPFGAPLSRDPIHGLTDQRTNQAVRLPLTPTGAAARNARKAWRMGLTVCRERHAWPELAALHSENMQRIGGRAKDQAFFAAAAKLRSADIWTVRTPAGELAGALLTFTYGAAVEYFTPVVAHDQRPNQPLAAILPKLTGADWLNFGGTWSTQEGVYRFKHKWGARDVTYQYFTQVNDASLFDATPAELTDAFGHFYVLPFGALRSAAA